MLNGRGGIPIRGQGTTFLFSEICSSYDPGEPGMSEKVDMIEEWEKFDAPRSRYDVLDESRLPDYTAIRIAHRRRRGVGGTRTMAARHGTAPASVSMSVPVIGLVILVAVIHGLY